MPVFGILRTYRSRREEHLDEHVEQIRRLPLGDLPVDRPLVQDADDEVTKDRLHEENLGQELGPDQLGALEVQVVHDLETDGERHLQKGCAGPCPSARKEEAKGEEENGDAHAGHRARSTSSS